MLERKPPFTTRIFCDILVLILEDAPQGSIFSGFWLALTNQKISGRI